MNPEEIKSRRAELKMTQAELSEIFGLNHNTISRWEQGRIKPEAEGMLRLAFDGLRLARLLEAEPELARLIAEAEERIFNRRDAERDREPDANLARSPLAASAARGCYVLASGREVRICSLILHLTYEGVYEGHPKQVSLHIKQRLAEQAKELFGWQARAFVALDADVEELPRFQWFARFVSRSGIRTQHSDYQSRLTICWFADELASDLRAMIESALARVDWDAQAEEYDFVSEW